jgi:hypothetical protein
MVDPVGQKLIHVNSEADRRRNPTFTFFGNPNFYFDSSGPASPVVYAPEAWNHGDIQPEIARTFIGIAGPGVRHLGVTQPSDFFTDHVDLRPTMLFLTGLTDDYQVDGRVILELVSPSVLPGRLRAHSVTLKELGQLYKQINAPFGELAQSTLAVSTYALESDSPGDVIYTNLEAQIASWSATRDVLVARIQPILNGAEFNAESIDELQARQVIAEAHKLLNQASDCAAYPVSCAYLMPPGY